MNHRIWTFSFLSALLAAGAVHAAPPTPEARLRLSTSGGLSVFEPEPFSFAPPAELRAALTERLAAAPTVHLSMVVILAEFSDRRANKTVSTPAHFDSLLFSRGIYPTGSMADYYYENSGGRLILSGQVRGWYQMPDTYQTYVGLQAGRGLYPTNVQGLVEDAVAAADPDVNYALFDSDGPDGVADTIDDDQRIDLLMVVHAGVGGESAGSRTNLQSLAWALPNLLPVDGVYASEFAVTPEEGALGVYAHETGHILGLPDLYDATGGSFGLGVWSLMAGGWSLDEARTPAHLDAWCKTQLGFVSMVPVFGTLEDVVFDPVEAGGKVYRLAKDGNPGGTEYFLVENREKIGFDRFLPGEGLLIYHVDELAPTNNIPARYRVGLEQADGLFQLENFFRDPSFGDAGDPYTGATPSGGFGRFTVPNSRNHDGVETGVAVYRIQGPDAAQRMTATLRPTKGPTARITTVDFVSTGGDGDPFVEGDETFEIRPTVTVQGGTTHDVTFEVVAVDPLCRTPPGPIAEGDLSAGNQVLAVAGSVGPLVPADPYGMKVELLLKYREEVAQRVPLTLPIGQTVGLAKDFETGPEGFTHHFLRAGYFDMWRQEPSGGSAGPRAWHCGRTDNGGFPKNTDSQLETPYFIIPSDGVLRFDQLVQIPRSDSNHVVAGAFLEISVNGGAWTQIAPTRGYDVRYFSGNLELNDRMIFTGGPPPPAVPPWETVTFDLSSFHGGAVARFRFFSTENVGAGLGWWIDNVRVESGGVPVRLASLSAVRVDALVRLAWSLAGEDDLSGLFVSRAPLGSSDFERLNDRLLPVAAAGEYVDAAPLSGSAAQYELHAVRRDGTSFRLGRVTIEESVAPIVLRLSAYPNPARGPVVFGFNLAAAGPVRLGVFDAAGRAVRSVADSRFDAGEHAVSWDGADDRGRAVSAGVYFYRLERGGTVQAGKLVVTR